jgi:hypothetical protein
MEIATNDVQNHYRAKSGKTRCECEAEPLSAGGGVGRLAKATLRLDARTCQLLEFEIMAMCGISQVDCLELDHSEWPPNELKHGLCLRLHNPNSGCFSPCP